MRRYVIAALAAAACVLGVAGTASAAPSVVPHLVSSTTVYDNTGVAGYYAYTSGHFTEVTTDVTLTQTGWALGQNTTAGSPVYGQGIGLCDESQIDPVLNTGSLPGHYSAETGDLGAVPIPGSPGFNVEWGQGYGDINTSAPYNPCASTPPQTGHGGSGPLALSPALAASVGDELQLTVKEDYTSGGIPVGTEYIAQDLTTATGVSKALGPPILVPDVALVGASQDTTALAPPAANPVANFSGLQATDSAGLTAGLDAWTAVQAVSNAGGVFGDPALLTPASSLTDVSGTPVCHLHRTWIKGHWGPWYDHHKKHKWHPGHFDYSTVCSSPLNVSSSLSIVAGGEVS